MAFLFLPIFDGLFAYKSGFCPLGGAGPGEEASPLPQTETINQNKDFKRAYYRGASATRSPGQARKAPGQVTENRTRPLREARS